MAIERTIPKECPMDLPVESWYQAISVRRSRRSFTGRTIAPDLWEKLAARFRNYQPFPGVRIAAVPRPPETVLRGVVGNYGRITGAPAYAAFIGDRGAANVQAAVGYAGEALILEATALGLDTCWVSGFFRPEAVRSDIEIAADERVFAVTPIGYAGENLTRRDRIYRVLVRSDARKPLTALVSGGALEPWQEKAVQAARLAPSASNRQPWRFSVGDGFVEIGAVGGRDGERFAKRLDCGIAMLHVELGARAAGRTGSWTFLEYPRVGRYEIIV
jgi:hypothetical protein